MDVKPLKGRILVVLSVMAVVACSGSDAADGPKVKKTVNDAGTDAPLTDAGGDPAATDARTNAPRTDAGGDPAATDAGGDPAATDAGTDAATADDHLAEQVVGAAGGTVTTNSGVSIEIPMGALASDVTITIDEVGNELLPGGATSLGKTIQFGPEGQTFASPVKVKLPWNGPNNVPVEIAHAPRGGSSWSTLTENTDFDATHVWAETSTFSWFQPVVYQGSPDTPIILDKDSPTGWTQFIAIESTPDLWLRGTGFRADTIVTLFKDGVTTANVTPVTLTKWGLQFTVPSAFTAMLGLVTIQAKNPEATVGDAAAVRVIKTPLLNSLSPSTVNIYEQEDNSYDGIPVSVSVTAEDLPDDLSLCMAQISQSFGEVGVGVADSTAPIQTETGFVVTVTTWHFVTGTSELTLSCRGVRSNPLPITFNLIRL